MVQFIWKPPLHKQRLTQKQTTSLPEELMEKDPCCKACPALCADHGGKEWEVFLGYRDSALGCDGRIRGALGAGGLGSRGSACFGNVSLESKYLGGWDRNLGCFPQIKLLSAGHLYFLAFLCGLYDTGHITVPEGQGMMCTALVKETRGFFFLLPSFQCCQGVQLCLSHWGCGWDRSSGTGCSTASLMSVLVLLLRPRKFLSCFSEQMRSYFRVAPNMFTPRKQEDGKEKLTWIFYLEIVLPNAYT